MCSRLKNLVQRLDWFKDEYKNQSLSLVNAKLETARLPDSQILLFSIRLQTSSGDQLSGDRGTN